MCTPSGLVIDVQGIISTMAPILKSEPQKEEVYWIGNLSTFQKEAQKWEKFISANHPETVPPPDALHCTL